MGVVSVEDGKGRGGSMYDAGNGMGKLGIAMLTTMNKCNRLARLGGVISE